MKKRKIPERKCIITNESRPKNELIRVVRTKEREVFVDELGNIDGRGAYLILEEAVISKAKKSNALGRQLGVSIPELIYEKLLRLAEKSNDES